jgi:hypothetical protein
MNRKLPLLITLLSALALGWTSCNSDDDTDSDELINGTGAVNTSTAVTAFSLKANSSILANLDSVYFTIDLDKGEIYNADSLPMGTDVSRLLVSATFPGVSGVEVVMPSRFTGNDTVVDLISNPSDSINFSKGSVTMRVSSVDGKYERLYTVKVNVHKLVPDSLQWSNLGNIPTDLPTVRSQRALTLPDGRFCIVARGDIRTTQAITSDPFDTNSWEITTLSMPRSVDISSLCVTADGTYYVLAGTTLYAATDMVAGDWTAVAEGWSYIYGSLQNKVVGVNADQTCWQTYPDGLSGEIPDDMPVKGTSQLVAFTSDWALAPQAIMVGGENAKEKYVGYTWAFDGNSWLRLSGYSNILPPAEGYSIFPYRTYRESDIFVITSYSTWIAIGGKLSPSTLQTNVYTSMDNGVNWKKADTALSSRPSEMPYAYASSVAVYDRTLYSAATRAIAPITQWEAPYVYLIGGKDELNAPINMFWRGIINRCAFKPLQ